MTWNGHVYLPFPETTTHAACTHGHMPGEKHENSLHVHLGWIQPFIQKECNNGIRLNDNLNMHRFFIISRCKTTYNCLCHTCNPWHMAFALTISTQTEQA